MKVQYISMVIYKEEQDGFLFKGVNKKTTCFAFDNKEKALEHQEQVKLNWNEGEACGVMVCVEGLPSLATFES